MAPVSGEPFVPVVPVVDVAACVVEVELAAVVVVDSNNEHPERTRDTASTATIDSTSMTLLVDFTMDRYLLCAFRDIGITPGACFNKPDCRPKERDLNVAPTVSGLRRGPIGRGLGRSARDLDVLVGRLDGSLRGLGCDGGLACLGSWRRLAGSRRGLCRAQRYRHHRARLSASRGPGRGCS
jgi:hypothetical protein